MECGCWSWGMCFIQINESLARGNSPETQRFQYWSHNPKSSIMELPRPGRKKKCHIVKSKLIHMLNGLDQSTRDLSCGGTAKDSRHIGPPGNGCD